eukprot:TRINITY_DN27616_c0_g1_i1.p1 TRINITY_DN27616_c0_g1~~TRINITY_DN27616_c0_g1_i1.p1  ORF type:complete len:579 (-),score=43.63 TRINITY_DN27616_c0_g1_i1:241-1818(-)
MELWRRLFNVGKDTVRKEEHPASITHALLERRPLSWGSEVIPEYYYDVDIRNFWNHLPENQDGTRYATQVVGPAVPWAWKAFKATVATFVLTPIIACIFTGFPASPGTCFVEVTPWTFLPLGICLFYLLWLEDKVRQITLITQVRMTAAVHGFKCMGFVLPFYVWLWLVRALSLVGHLDIVSTGIFVAKIVLSNAFASSSSPIPSLWRLTMETSIVEGFAGDVSFTMCTVVIWCLIASQGVYAVACTFPRHPRNIDSQEPMAVHYRPCVDNSEIVIFDTLVAKDLTLWDTVEVLADTARMRSVTFQFNVNLRKGFEDSPDGVIALLGSQMVRSSWRFFIFSILESALMLNIQSAGLALSVAVKPGHTVDLQTLASIVFGLLVAVQNLCYEVVKVQSFREMIAEFDSVSVYEREARRSGFSSVREQYDEYERIFLEGSLSKEERKEYHSALVSLEVFRKQVDRARQSFWLLYPLCVLMWVVYALLVSRAAFQTVMASCVCPLGLHNIGSGCVSYPDGRLLSRRDVP